MDASGGAAPAVRELRQGADLLGRYHRFDAEPPVAELFEPAGDLGRVVDAILSDLAGWSLTTTDDALAEALVGRGAVPTRHFALMSRDLRTWAPTQEDAAMPPWLDIRHFGPSDEVPRGVIELVRAAYPPGHPDVELGGDDDIVHDIRRAQGGDRLGPLMDMSALVFDQERLVGLVLVNRVPGEPPVGGPWITDVCRDPDRRYAGLGRSLLTGVIRACVEGGEPALSLAVTEGNPARLVYESLGFSVVAVTRKVRIPD